MKKRVFSVLLCLGLLTSFCSCRQTDTLIDLSAFDDAFRTEHSMLFANDTCEHALRYQNMPDALAEDNTTIYHRVSCYYGNCDLEAHLEPHTIDSDRCTVVGNPMVKENGCLYHQVVTHCEFCEIYPYFYIYVLCPKQDADCGRKDNCLDGADWREILCDTPYAISED
ncbi:MAG: hypothetical protein IJ489_06150 [Clostridia bacterium]|nr:hypothetical protein [Clostridia bacterium]